jgi:hypothetical protein
MCRCIPLCPELGLRQLPTRLLLTPLVPLAHLALTLEVGWLPSKPCATPENHSKLTLMQPQMLTTLCSTREVLAPARLLAQVRTSIESGRERCNAESSKLTPVTPLIVGMVLDWPQQGVYTSNIALWDQVLFQNANYVTTIIPNFRAFLQWFLSSGTPSASDGTTVCGQGAEVSTPDVAGDQPLPVSDDLIVEDSGTADATTGLFELTATIAPAVSQMLVEYGIDLSTPLKPVLEEKGFTPTDDEYLYLLGGDVAGAYDGNTFKASWDQNFYFLNITGSTTYEALYVFDLGDGSRKIPAMYFPEENREDVAGLQFMDFLQFDFDYWIEQGARFSFVQFSVNETEGRINDNLSLFISNAAGVFTEQPRSAGGYLIPIVYVDAFIQGRELTTLPGGFNQTVIPWTETLGYYVLKTPALNIFNVIPSTDAVVINMYAYDHGNATRKPDVRRYDVKRERGALPGSLALETTDPAAGAGASAATPWLNPRVGFAAGLGVFLYGLF